MYCEREKSFEELYRSFLVQVMNGSSLCKQRSSSDDYFKIVDMWLTAINKQIINFKNLHQKTQAREKEMQRLRESGKEDNKIEELEKEMGELKKGEARISRALPAVFHGIEDHLLQYYHPHIKHIANISDAANILCTAHPSLSTDIRALTSIQIDFHIRISKRIGDKKEIINIPVPIMFSSHNQFASEPPLFNAPSANPNCAMSLMDLRHYFSNYCIQAPRWVIEQLRHGTALYHESMHQMLDVARTPWFRENDEIKWGDFLKTLWDRYIKVTEPLKKDLLPNISIILNLPISDYLKIQEIPSNIIDPRFANYTAEDIAGVWAAGFYGLEVLADCAGCVLFCGPAGIHSFANRFIVQTSSKDYEKDFKSSSEHPHPVVRIWYMIKTLEHLKLNEAAKDCARRYIPKGVDKTISESQDIVTRWIRNNFDEILNVVSFINNGQISLNNYHIFNNEEELFEHWKGIVVALSKSDILSPEMDVTPADILNAMWYYLLREEEYRKNNIKISRLAWRLALSSWLKNNISTYVNTYLPKEEEEET